MNPRKLRHVLALHEEGSFVKAAARVNVTQSALSRSIQALESDLQLTLFDRTRDGVVATAAGRHFIARAQQVARMLSGFEHDMRALRGGAAGVLRFGIGPFPASSFLTDALAGLARECRELRVSVEINNAATLAEHLKAERIEFFIADTSQLREDREIAITPLARQSGIVACRAGHPLAASSNAPDMAQLARFGFASVHFPPADHLPSEIQQLLRAWTGGATEPAPLALSCDNLDVLKRVVLQSDLILMSTRAVVREELERGELVELPLPGADAVAVTMGVASLRDRSLSPAAQAVISRMRDVSAALESAPPKAWPAPDQKGKGPRERREP